MMQATTKDALRLLLEASKTFSQVERNGLVIDTVYLDEVIKDTSRRIALLEIELKEDKVWKEWSRIFKDKANLGSTYQLGQLLFKYMKYPITSYTKEESELEEGEERRPKADEAALEQVNLPFVKTYLKLRHLQKMKGTYLEGIKREVVDGLLHPIVNIHTVDTYRSSYSLINFQNLPMRNLEMMRAIRRSFIPRKGNRIVEIDIVGAEVKVALFYHKDPAMLRYLTDRSTDMHRDQAVEIFLLPPDIAKQPYHKKTTRDSSKNMFVFPQFYGSYYIDCAKAMWAAMERRDFRLTEGGITIREHLAKKGITSLGRCKPDESPVPGTFEYHIQQVEKKLWQSRFPVYTQWKNSWYNEYLQKGYFDMYTGFRCKGLYRRNQVINYPVQGSAFHCLLWGLIMLQKQMTELKMRSMIVGQIHDCIVLDVVPYELNRILDMAHEIMTVKLPRAWQWITIPLEIEAEVCEPDASWVDKRIWTRGESEWQLKG